LVWVVKSKSKQVFNFATRHLKNTFIPQKPREWVYLFSSVFNLKLFTFFSCLKMKMSNPFETTLTVSTEIKDFHNKNFGKFVLHNFERGGRNVKFQNVDRPNISERRKCVLSWSERQNQKVENVFWVDHYYNDQNVENRLLT
jgi:hypothetical protein